ncbi:MAG: isochorismatase family protein [Gammaproteobacteria bacterium]
MKTALIVIDVQQSFQHRPYWREDDVKPFLTRIQTLIDKAAASGIPVLQVFHVEEQDGPANPFSSKSGYVKSLSALRIAPTEVFHKDVHSSLYGRAANGRTLEQWLRDFGIEHVIVTGIRTEQCCETTTRHASDAGFKVTYALDATLTFPMVSKSGRTFSPAELMERTELVLQGRFADVLRTEAIAF